MAMTVNLPQTPTASPGVILSPNLMALGTEAAIAAQAPIRPQLPPKAKQARASSAVERMLGLDIPFTAIQGEVSRGIESGIQAATAAEAEAEAVSQFSQALEQLMGGAGGETLDDWLTRLAAHGNSPAAILAGANRLTEGLAEIGKRITALQSQTEGRIEEAVTDVNSALDGLANINCRLSIDSAYGSDVSGLIDQRDSHLAMLFTLLDVVSFLRGDGSAAIYTKSGQALIDGPFAKKLAFARGRRVTVDGKDIGPQISAGRLFGLLSLRDNHLGGLHEKLDALALLLQQEVNKSFNRAIAIHATASSHYAGTRIFLNPAEERLSLSGGDTVLTLVDEANHPLAAVSVNMLMRRHLQGLKLAVGASWTVAQMVEALDRWLTRHLKSDAPCAYLDESGRVNIFLNGGRLAIRDQKCSGYDSAQNPEPDKPLRLSGRLEFCDQFGNSYGIAVSPNESLRSLATTIQRESGLKASLVAARQGHVLRINNGAGCDLYLEPGPVGEGLGLMPTHQMASCDVQVEWDSDNHGPMLLSAPFADEDTPLGLTQTLRLGDQTGLLAEVQLQPDWSLGDVGFFMRDSGLTGQVRAAGNRRVLRFTAQPGQAIWAGGEAAPLLGLRPPADLTSAGFASFLGLNDFFCLPERRHHHLSKPLPMSFALLAPAHLILTQRGSRRIALRFDGGSSLDQIAARLRQDAQEMVQAELQTDHDGQRLSLTAVDGGPLLVTGSLAPQLGLGEIATGCAGLLSAQPIQLPGSAPMLLGQALGKAIPTASGEEQSLTQAAAALVAENTGFLARYRDSASYQRILKAGLSKHRRRLNQADMDQDAVVLNTYRDAYLVSSEMTLGLSSLSAALAGSLAGSLASADPPLH